jgi:hypothetical protein
VDNKEVVAGEPFTVLVTIVSDGNGAMSELTLPDITGVRVLGNNRSEGTQVQIGGAGAVYRRTIRVVLTVVADKVGKVVVGKGHARVGNDYAENTPITLRVLPAGARGQVTSPPPQQQGHYGQQVSPPPPPQPPVLDEPIASDKSGVKASPAMVKAGMFATLEADKAHVMLGEQVTLLVRLFSKADLSDIEALRLPKMDGFWSETLENPQRITPTSVMVEGQRFQAYLLRRMAVFPTKSGTFELAAVEADVTTGGGFFSQGRRHRAQSLPLTLTVDPLPAEGQPPNFQSGNVGHFTLDARLDRDRISMSQPATLTVRMQGYGNLRQASVPRLPDTNDYRVYDPTPTEEILVKQDRFTGFKQLDFLIQAKHAGVIELPRIALSFFDTDTRKYVTLHGPPLRLTVTADDATAAQGTTPRGNVLAAQARPLRNDVDATTRRFPALRTLPFANVLLGAPLMLALFTLSVGGGLRIRRQRRGNDVSLKAREATRQLLSAVSAGGDSGAIHGGVQAFLAVRLGPTVAGMTRAELSAALGKRGVDPADVARVMKLLDHLDTARYSPMATGGTALADEAVAVVRSLDRVLGEDA